MAVGRGGVRGGDKEGEQEREGSECGEGGIRLKGKKVGGGMKGGSGEKKDR